MIISPNLSFITLLDYYVFLSWIMKKKKTHPDYWGKQLKSLHRSSSSCCLTDLELWSAVWQMSSHKNTLECPQNTTTSAAKLLMYWSWTVVNVEMSFRMLFTCVGTFLWSWVRLNHLLNFKGFFMLTLGDSFWGFFASCLACDELVTCLWWISSDWLTCFFLKGHVMLLYWTLIWFHTSRPPSVYIT